MPQPYHIPALLTQAVDALNIRDGGTYVDATFGGGGHSRAIIENVGPSGHLLGFDQDAQAADNRIDDPRFTFVYGNFSFLTNYLGYYGFEKVDGILADIGVSFHHFDASERGFSFREEGPLDMRMNTESSLTAAALLQEMAQEQLEHVLKVYGEVDNARKIARALVERRTTRPLATTTELYDFLRPLVDPRREKKEIAKVFQALRIAVNRELEALEALLAQAVTALRPGGRLVIISYHSLEDRMVKNFMKTGNIEGKATADIYGRIEAPFKLLTSKPVMPDTEEVERNPRSRSAKMRVAVKL